MWSLYNSETGSNFYMLPEKEKYTISRNNDCGDLILSNDSSISRKHAYLRLNEEKLYVSDAGSKYGTFINENIDTNESIKPNESIELTVNDKIRFGRLKNIWCVQKFSIITLPSTLSTKEKEILVKDITKINGQVLQSWSNNCTHLTVSNLTVTIKVLQALCHGIPIVKPSYWKSMISAAKIPGQCLPKYDDFLPPIAEQFLVSNSATFTINLNRKTIFSDRMFIFMIKKHMEQFESVVKLAGGTCISLDQQKVHKKTFIKSNVSVIQYNPSTQSQTSQDIITIIEYLSKNNCRTIPDSEIGLAILNCSTEKFCNGKYNREKDFDVDTLKPSTSKILAENTPISMVNSNNSDEQINLHKEIVPETEESGKEKLLDSVTKNNDVISKIGLEKENQLDKSTDDSLEKICLVQESNTEPSSSSLFMSAQINETQQYSGMKRKSSNQLDLPVNKKKAIENPTSQNFLNFITPKQRIQNIETPTLPSPPPETSTNQQNKPSTSRKRVQELLANNDNDNNDNDNNNDDDDDDDNIFQFNKNPVPMKKAKISNETSQTEDPFAFTVKPKTIRTANLSQSSTSQLSQQQSRTKIKIFDKTIKPIKYTLDGWLSASTLLSNLKIKSEDLNEKTAGGDAEETKSWINEIQNAFQVNIKHMDLVSKTRNISNIESSSITSQNKNGLNFKAFVKKTNYIPQTKVLKTVVFH